MKREFRSEEEMMDYIWAVEDIKKLVYKRAVYVTNGWRQKELDDFWVRDPELQKTASFGRNIGWYVGMDHIAEYYVNKHQRDLEAHLAAIAQNNAAVANVPENLGIGCACTHTPSTGLVQVAGDGKTAKAMFYSIAQETISQPDGTAKALWVPEKQAFDLVNENGEWKIWHLVLATDITCEAGTNFEDHSPYAEYDTDPVMQEFGTPTIPCLCHDSTFNWWDNYPPMPKAYETFSDDISYGPEGYHPPEYFALRAREGAYQ